MFGSRNIFIIGRSKLGPEDRLTEMLAYLWEQRPDLIAPWLESLPGVEPPEGEWQVATQVVESKIGRFDLTLGIPDRAAIIVECKLDAELMDEQPERYLKHLAGRPESLRVLVALTRDHVRLGQQLKDSADKAGVVVAATRWQDLAEVLGNAGEGGVAGEFVDMLIEGRLVMPESFSGDDWGAWNRGAAVLARIKTLLMETRAGVEGISTGLKANSRWGADERWIYSGFQSDRLEIGLGFSANESAKRPDSGPIIWTYLKNKEIASADATSAAIGACRHVAGSSPVWAGYPAVTKSAAEVLAGEDFRQQTRQAVRFAYEIALQFKNIGYLPSDLELVDPTASPTA